MTPQGGALVRSRLRSAKIPKRCEGMRFDSPEVAEICGTMKPSGLIFEWMNYVREGKIISSDNYSTCGKGLWIKGGGGVTPLVACMQDLIVEGTIMSALYVRTEDYLRSERPEGEREYRGLVTCDVMVLAGYGSERRTESGWAEATLDDLIVSRFDKGLPTLVTSLMVPPTSFAGYLDDKNNCTVRQSAMSVLPM